MSNDNIIKLVAILVIPVIIFFARSYVQEFLSANGGLVLDLTPMENIEKVSQQNSASVNILKQYNSNFMPNNVLASVEPKNLYRYFLPPVKEEPKVIDEPVIEAPKPKARPRVKLPPKPTYNVDFVFVGNDMSYISLGGNLLEIGDTTPKGEVIRNIENNRIQLQGKWGLRWVSVNY